MFSPRMPSSQLQASRHQAPARGLSGLPGACSPVICVSTFPSPPQAVQEGPGLLHSSLRVLLPHGELPVQLPESMHTVHVRATAGVQGCPGDPGWPYASPVTAHRPLACEASSCRAGPRGSGAVSPAPSTGSVTGTCFLHILPELGLTVNVSIWTKAPVAVGGINLVGSG